MSLDYQHILDQNGLADKPVLLSERTQQIVISTIDFYLRRAAWDVMSDTDWDELDASLADAITEILTIQELPVSTYHEASRASTQAIAANTDTKIQFNAGATPPQDWNVPVPSAGICTVTARIVLLSAVAGAKSARLLHNDTEIAMLAYGSTALSQVFTMSQVLEVEAGDYFSLQVNCVTASNSQIAPFTPKISMVVAGS